MRTMAQFGDTTLRHLTMGLAVAGGLAIAGHAARAEEAVAAKETAGEAEAEAAQISRPLPKGFTHVSEEMREGLEPVEKADFDILQVRPGTDFSTYRRVYLEPLAYDLFDPRIQEGVTEQDRSFLERTLVRQYERRMGGVVDVVDTIEEGTLVLNLTVTDVRPNRDILGSFPLQRGGRAINQQSVGIGGIAIEGVFSDGETGAIVAATKDRYEGFPLQANPNLFTRYGDARDGMRIYFRKVADLLK